jgi:hypothetical protein
MMPLGYSDTTMPSEDAMSEPDRVARDWWDPRSIASSASGAAAAMVKPLAGGAAQAVSAGVDAAPKVGATALRGTSAVVSAGVDAAPKVGATALRGTSAVVSAGVDAAPRVGASALRSSALDGRRLLSGLDGRRLMSGLERALERALDSEQAAAIAGIVARSAALDEMLRQLAANDGLWALIDVIAGSPAVREAVTQQSVGLAGEVGNVVRGRARGVDDRIERVTRFGRRGPPAAAAEPDPGVSQ